MAFKPYCQTCKHWHNPTDPHMSFSFEDILNAAPTEAATIPVLPEGTYIATIKKFEQQDEGSNRPHRFPIQIVSPLDDVDQDELEAAGGAEGKFVSYNIWNDERAAASIDALHAAAGLDLEELGAAGISRLARNDMVEGQQILVHVKHSINKKTNKINANVDSIAKL